MIVNVKRDTRERPLSAQGTLLLTSTVMAALRAGEYMIPVTYA